ncbi:MAG: 4Fe-4S dicluster domain-containing protein [Desulfobacterales bacterium]|nr:4Fe-4S dicluster domain-containing protein [Desulfobacterales bacterium]
MISVDISKCSGCRRCEVSCSFIRSGKIGRSLSRIKVMKVEEIGIDFPVLCQLCKEQFCTRCQKDAIHIGDLGQIIVSPTLCNACGSCESSCPIGAIELYQEIPYVCDLCGGDPRCIKACNLGALIFEPEKKGTVSLKRWTRRNKGLSPDEKRLNFILDQAAYLRKAWILSRGT